MRQHVTFLGSKAFLFLFCFGLFVIALIHANLEKVIKSITQYVFLFLFAPSYPAMHLALWITSFHVYVSYVCIEGPIGMSTPYQSTFSSRNIAFRAFGMSPTQTYEFVMCFSNDQWDEVHRVMQARGIILLTTM